MKNKYRLIGKITNLFGIVFIMLGVIPVSVLSQVGSVYAAEQVEDGAAAIVIPIFTSYAELLGSTPAKSSAEEMTVVFPDISGKHGDWISLAILGPVLADEGDGDTPDVPAEDGGETPAEEPPAEEPPAEEPPAEEPPAEEPPTEEPVCEGECAPEPAEEPVEEAPAEEPVEEAVIEGCTDPLAENYNEAATLDDGSCYIIAEELPAEEPPAEEPLAEEDLSEVVQALAEADAILVDENGEEISLASEEAAETLAATDPYFYSGGEKYCFVYPGGDCSGCYYCDDTTATPTQQAINYAATHTPDDGTIYVESGTYAGFTIDNFGSDLIIQGAGIGTTTYTSQIYLTNNNNIDITLSNFTAYEANHLTPTILALNNSGTITLENLNVSHTNYHGSAIYIYAHDGDVVMDHVSASGSGCLQSGAYIDNRIAGSGNNDVIITNSNFTTVEYYSMFSGHGLEIHSSGSVLLDGVTVRDSAHTVGYHGAVIDNTSGTENVAVLNSIFFNNSNYGLKVFSKGWIVLDNVTANDNWAGAYLETSGSKVVVKNSDFLNTINGSTQWYGLEINNLGSHETSICDVEIHAYDHVKTLVLRSPDSSDDGSYYVYNICRFTAPDTCSCEIYVYGENENNKVIVNFWPYAGLDTSDISITGYVDLINQTTGNCGDNCATPSCGDGTVQGWMGEECDDGNQDNTDACTDSCHNATCGDGYVWVGVEGCDLGTGNNSDTLPDTCRTDCTLPTCGDAVVDPGEECDGTTLPAGVPAGTACNSCVLGPYCGDNTKDTGEECDDGNATSGDGCNSECYDEYCGDKIVNDTDETCDDGGTVSNDGCSSTCQIESCGDGIVQTSEGCDDGNTTGGDGCSATCTVEPPPPTVAEAAAAPVLFVIPVTGGQLVELPCDTECVTLELPDGSQAEFCGLCGYSVSLAEELEETIPFDMPAGKMMVLGMTVVLMDPDQVILDYVPAGATLKLGYPLTEGVDSTALSMYLYDPAEEEWVELTAEEVLDYLEAYAEWPGTSLLVE